MARKSCVQFLRSRFVIAALPLICAAFVSLSGCDKPTDQPTRRYCDQSGCYECTSSDTSRCYPVAGEPVKPDPGPAAAKCDNDAACGAAKVCNLGKCEAGCTDDKGCASGLACVAGRCRPGDSSTCGTTGARCTGDAQCGADQKCVGRVCATNCTAGKCATGQVCDSGSCVEDKNPTSPQCLYDSDCNAGKGGFRCVNAYCLASCADSNTCQNGTTCLKGICRGSR